ncbi:MAG: mannose-1-phosphate guanylyltransferase [Myxococcota bacterium]|jgi:mannose-1-phosphate guanylyltransferase
MAGGSGTRFWPMSRRTNPKQLLDLVTAKSLLIETVTRIAPKYVPYDRVLIVTGEALAGPIDEAVGPLGVRTLVEPMARNTAPCIAFAAAVVAAESPDAVMAVLPSDQHIADTAEYRRVFQHAAAISAEGRIVTLGIRPDRPETGYGYIRRGAEQGSELYAVDAFVEKPDLETAKGYLEDGRYDWNSGMFFMRADTLLKAVDDHMPGLAEGIAGYRAAIGTTDEAAALVTCFEKAEPISIDYGVMEKEAGNISVVPADFGWSDVGSWRTLLDFRDGQSNFTRGPVDLRDTEDCVVVSTGPYVATIGLRGLSVVATGDAVLVTPLDRAQEVGQIPKDLNAAGKKELT